MLENDKVSGTKKEHKPKLLSPDIFRGVGFFHVKGVGAKKFGILLETREIKLFWPDIPGFCSDISAVPEKFEKQKKSVFYFWTLNFCTYFFAEVLSLRGD